MKYTYIARAWPVTISLKRKEADTNCKLQITLYLANQKLAV